MIMFSILIFLSFKITAEEKKISDPFDLSKSKSQVDELGIVTKTEVDTLEEKIRGLYSKGKCKEVIPLLDEYAKKSNWLANLISYTLEPYYGASYDDRKTYTYSKLEPLVPLETLSNNYKKKRNIAIAMHGDCMLRIGDRARAIPLLTKSLDLLSLENEEWWEKTRNNLLSIVEVSLN